MLHKAFLTLFFAIVLAPAFAGIANVTGAGSTPKEFYRITIVDSQTSRGIPMVKATLVNKTDYFTDSAGVIAFQEPDLWNCDVEITLETYGYSYAKNWFGQQTVRVTPTPGGSTVVAMQRENIAQRLYRTTGSGIYRDSVLLGDKVPQTEDTSPMHIMGIDGSQTAIYQGKMFWVRGDTGISATGLGNFKSTGIITDLPGKGGLDPEVGIYMKYIREPNGRPKGMIKTDHKGPVWIGGLRAVRDAAGKEHLYGNYMKVAGGMAVDEHGLMEYNDVSGQFEQVAVYTSDLIIEPAGTPFRYKDNGTEYVVFVDKGVGDIRCKADAESAKDLAAYEAFTCLKEGSRFDGSAGQLDRDADGRLRWGWKKNTSPVIAKINQLLKAGHIKPEEVWFRLTDIRNGKEIQSHGATIYWNDYRTRWICLQEEEFGASWLGEIWYFEGDTPLGPWVYGQKIATHTLKDESKAEGKRIDEQMAEKGKKVDSRSFYCIKHHPEFDKDGGRVIFFEGTLSMSFSDAAYPIPRYDYNELMYRVELDDSRLFLPVPVYQVKGEKAGLYTKLDLPNASNAEEIAFFAPDRPREATIGIYQVTDAVTGKLILSKENQGAAAKPAFYAVDADANIPSTSSISVTVPLYEYLNSDNGERIYSTKEKLEGANFKKTEKPVCRVWPNPIKFNPYRLGTRMEPVPAIPDSAR